MLKKLIKIKRGCSEYYDVSTIIIDDKALKYNSDWQSYENKFDEKNPDLIYDKSQLLH